MIIKKTILHLLILLIQSICFSQAPTIEWQKTLGGSNDDRGWDIIQTSDGGYIATGFAESNDGDLTENQGLYDIWVVKLNSTSDIQWQKTFGGTDNEQASEILQTNDGGYIISGYTASNDGNVSIHYGGADYWIIKLDSFGNLEWERNFGGTSADFGVTIKQTAEGGYIIGGGTQSNDIDLSGSPRFWPDFWIVKIDSIGNIEWEKTFGGTFVDFFFDIEESNDGGYIIGGRVASDDGDITINQGGFDSWVVKINSVGTIEWQKTFGGTTNDYMFDIQKTLDGGFITVGFTISNDGDISVNQGNGDCWVVKFSGSGTIEWEKTFGGTGRDEANMISQTSDGNYIFVGFTNSTDGDITFNNGSYDFWIVKIDVTGNILWQKTVGGPGEDYGYSIQQANDGGFITLGYTNSTSGDITENNGLNDFWVVKLTEEALSINTTENDNLKIYPNPATTVLNIETKNKLKFDKLVITDLTGKLVSEQKVKNSKINIEKLPSGVYILKLTSGEKNYRVKFVKH